MTLEEIHQFTLDIAQQAGALIAHERQTLDIRFKDNIELVTQADVAADTLITRAIQQTFPEHTIVSEELAPDSAADGDHVWIIDPIDGTVNYAHGHPQVAISIAYYQQGKAQVGVVHNPFLQETFHAIRGQGAFLNDESIACSQTGTLRRAIIATGFPYQKDTIPQLIARLQNILTECADVRRLGSAALDICWVACGRLDAYYESVKIWDMAAAQLIAREAGATVGHFLMAGKNDNLELNSDNLLISNPNLFNDLTRILGSNL